MVEHVHGRVMKWLGRRGLLRRDDDDSARYAPSAAEALALFGMQRGKLVAMREGATAATDEAADATPPPPPRKTGAAEHDMQVPHPTGLRALPPAPFAQ